MTETEYVNFAEAARMLEKSRATVYRLMSSGLLTPHYRPRNPRAPVFARSEVEALDAPGPREPVQNLALHEEAKVRDGRCIVCYFEGERLIAHHALPLEQGGADALDNLVTLCPLCHGAVHANGLGLEWRARKNSTEAVVNWLLRSSGLPEIDFSAPARTRTF